jgi:hypothetical protein
MLGNLRKICRMNRRWFATVVGRLFDGSVVAIPADPALHPVRDNPNLRQVLLVGEYPRSAQYERARKKPMSYQLSAGKMMSRSPSLGP